MFSSIKWNDFIKNAASYDITEMRLQAEILDVNAEQ